MAAFTPQGAQALGEEQLTIEMLGAGQEVGRSCCVLQYKGKTIVCDAGVHPAYNGMAALPFIDELDWSTVDALLITHFHLDHAAALTYIMEKTNFKDGKGKVYMTHPTKAVYRILMSDFVRISSAGSDDQLFDESEMLESWRQIEAIDFHQEVSVGGGLRFTSYHAGHVLGACMFLIEIAGLRILYTGDFSREEDRHLVQAEVPPVRPDVLISESTYGTQTHPPRLEKEERFTSLIHTIVKRGGRVLLPVFVLGRAQELLLLLDEYWAANPELHTIPIYYASSMARKCISIYQTYIHTMNEHVRSRFNKRDNPFVFKHISNLRSLDKFDDKGPCVMMASPGFMQSGVSRELLERWAPDPKNGIIISGYSVEGTMARTIMSSPTEIIAVNGQRIPRRLTVDYISFSAHVDFAGNSQFIDAVKPQHLVLVHGERTGMNRFRLALQGKYAARSEDIKIHMPKNCEPLKIKFRGEHTAKAIGTIAAKPPTSGSTMTGLLVLKDFAYTILDPSDLTDFTGLSATTIVQRQRLCLSVGWALVRWHLEGMYGRVDEGVDMEGLRTYRIMDVVDVKLEDKAKGVILLEWVAGVAADMVADSAVALLIGTESSPASVKMTTHAHTHDHLDDKVHIGINGDGDGDGSELVPAEPHPHATAHRSAFGQAASDHQQPTARQQEEASHAAAMVERAEHFAGILEAHFGNVEEVMVGEDEEATAQSNIKVEDGSEATVVDSLDEDVALPLDTVPEVEGLQSVPAIPNPTAPNSDLTTDQSVTKEKDGENIEELDPITLIRGPKREALMVVLDGEACVVEIESLRVTTSSPMLRARVTNLIRLGVQSLVPLSDSYLFDSPLTSPLFRSNGASGGKRTDDSAKESQPA